jgi:integrase
LMLSENNERARFLSDSELTATLKASKEHSLTMHVAVLVSLACGVRQSELLRLAWSDIDFDAHALRVQLSKNGESRSVYLPSSAETGLRELKRGKVVGARVFVDDEGQPVGKNWIEYRWKAIRKAARLVDFRWHDLRHSCASYLAQNGSTLLEIGSVLGHKSPSVTQRYAHLVAAKPVTGHAKLDEKLSRS